MDAQKEQAIKLLAHGMNAEAVAAKVGTTSRSLRRWKNDPEFAAELSDAIGDVKDNILFHVNPIIHNAQLHADEALIRNKELLKSDNSVIANRACNQASNNAIKWIKLFMALEHAANTRQLAAATRAIVVRASSLPVPESESDSELPGGTGLRARTSPSPSPEPGPGPGSGPGDEVTSVKNPSESGQNRTQPGTPIPAQPEAAQPVAPESAPPPSVSAPDTNVAQASSLQASVASPAGSRRGDKGAWKGKNPNHVPFYKKFQRR